MIEKIPYVGPILRVLKAVWDFVWGAIADGLEWLRKPGHKLKAVTGVLAIAAAWASFQAYDRGRQIVVVTTQCAADKDELTNTCKVEKGRLSEVINNKQAALDAINAALREEAAKLEALRGQYAELQHEVDRKTAAADRSAAAFGREYANRTPTCKSALAVLAQACPTLGGY